MQRRLIVIGVALATFSVGIVVTRILSLGLTSQSSIAIPAIQFQNHAPCIEAQTSSAFSKFFSEFRDALKSNDMHKLFTMTRRCNFDWYADVALTHPLQYGETSVPSQLEPPFGNKPILRSPWAKA